MALLTADGQLPVAIKIGALVSDESFVALRAKPGSKDTPINKYV